MSELLHVGDTDKVLEFGTGSGYQAAILSALAREVYTIEIIPELGTTARNVLARLGYTNVKTKIGDGYQGWKEYAPSSDHRHCGPGSHSAGADRATQTRWVYGYSRRRPNSGSHGSREEAGRHHDQREHRPGTVRAFDPRIVEPSRIVEAHQPKNSRAHNRRFHRSRSAPRQSRTYSSPAVEDLLRDLCTFLI